IISSFAGTRRPRSKLRGLFVCQDLPRTVPERSEGHLEKCPTRCARVLFAVLASSPAVPQCPVATAPGTDIRRTATVPGAVATGFAPGRRWLQPTRARQRRFLRGILEVALDLAKGSSLEWLKRTSNLL